MKFKAWTMAELTVAVVVIIILSAVSMSVTKNNNINKARIFMYVTLRNLNLGNVAVTEANSSEFYPSAAAISDGDSSVVNDWYCLHLVDNFTLKGSANCTKTYNSEGSADVNFTFTNGVTFQGFASEWKTAYSGLDYKNVVIDIDGDKGSNKVGVDRFPMRIYKGKTHLGDNANGMIFPVQCENGKDELTNAEGEAVTLTHPYCYDGFSPSGSLKNNNLGTDDEIITNNIYRVTDANKETSAQAMIQGLSTIEADCSAHGPKGFYGARICAKYGFKLSEKCAHSFVCLGCNDGTNNVCPDRDDEGTPGDETTCNAQAAANESAAGKAFRCFVFLNRPTSGLGLIGSAIMQEMGL